MFENSIFIHLHELETYRNTGNSEVINNFIEKIKNTAPKNLKLSLENQYFDLQPQNPPNSKLTGAIAFKFNISEISDDVKNFLHTFTVFVENDLAETVLWKQRIHELLQSPNYKEILKLKAKKHLK